MSAARVWMSIFACAALAGCDDRDSTGGGSSGGVPSAGTVQFSDLTYSVPEVATAIPLSGSSESGTILVTRTGGSAGVASVRWSTVAGGTATPGQDYVAGSGTLTWADGEIAPKAVPLLILGDDLVEGPETIVLELGDVQGAALGAPASAVVTIVDDDVDAPLPPIIPLPTGT